MTTTLGDLNADGRLDLFATGYDEELIDNYGATRRDHYVNVLRGNGDGTFGPSNAYYVTSRTPLGTANSSCRCAIITPTANPMS